MSEIYSGLQVGQTVPDFKLETYEPSKGDFGEISLETLKANLHLAKHTDMRGLKK